MSRMTREIKKMKKMTLALGLLATAVFAHAADPLNGTVWKTIDDQTKQIVFLIRATAY